VAGLTASAMLSRWVWLEMRVKTGLLIPVLAVVFLVVGARRRWAPSGPALVALQLTAMAALLAAGGFQDGVLSVLPSALVRDGLGLSGVSLGAINRGLLSAAAAANICWVLEYRSS